MRVVTLLENTAASPEFKSRHGISFYIETANRKILFDSGPDPTFLENAETLGVDLSAIDSMILSHGHSDHGGGLSTFMKVNSKARIIMKDTAINKFFVKSFFVFKINIGLKLDDSEKQRIEFISESIDLDETTQIFTGFQKTGFIPAGNASLFTKDGNGKDIGDPFDHEIALLIREKAKNILFTGCSHSGLGNMMRSVKIQAGIDTIDTVIGGFHLYNPVTRKTESNEQIDCLIEELSDFPEAIYYTGHCTGSKAFEYMQTKLKDRVFPFKTGMTMTI